jgi:putative ABC transport system permease protein
VVLELLRVAAQVGLQYGPFVLGLYLVFNVMSVPDLTVEGAFALGAGAAAVMISNDHSALLAIAVGTAVGAVAGLVSGLLHVAFGLNMLLAGILTTAASWSVNLRVLGRGNVGLGRHRTMYSWFGDRGIDPQYAAIWIGSIAAVLTVLFLLWFLSTGYGLSIRATGRSIQTARGVGIRTEQRHVVGLMTANGLAGLSGALVAQQQGFADVGASTGVIVIGLAALMIGQSLIRSRRLWAGVLSAIVGIVVYRFVVAWVLRLGLKPGDVRLVTSAAVIVAIIARLRLHWIFFVPGTTSAMRRRRDRIQFLEEDRVTPIL